MYKCTSKLGQFRRCEMSLEGPILNSMLIKKRFGSLQNDLKKKAMLALAATAVALGSMGGIAVAQEFTAVPQEASVILEDALAAQGIVAAVDAGTDYAYEVEAGNGFFETVGFGTNFGSALTPAPTNMAVSDPISEGIDPNIITIAAQTVEFDAVTASEASFASVLESAGIALEQSQATQLAKITAIDPVMAASIDSMSTFGVSDTALFTPSEQIANAIVQANMATEQAALFAPKAEIARAVVAANVAFEDSILNASNVELAASINAATTNAGTVASVNAGDTTAPWILWLAGIAIAGIIFMMLYWAVVNRPPSIRTPMPIGA